MTGDYSSIKKKDAELVAAAGEIKILSNLNWEPRIGIEFLERYQSGNPALPQVTFNKISYNDEKKRLRSVIASCDRESPLEKYIIRTAQSYITAAEMIESMGTPAFTERSIALYGSPVEEIFPGTPSHLDAALNFINATDSFADSAVIPEGDVCILPETVAEELRRRMAIVFKDYPIGVEIDPHMASKAAAGATRVRLRGSTCFSKADIQQLAEHECFVHTLTAINGLEQPYLSSLGLGAPRTTRTQEGLALFAELITHCMDLNRLRRVALRVIAVDMGLKGANFLEVFEFFLNNDQTPFESYQSTYRVFRGGSVTGNIAFTKDITYLAGLSDVHTFFRRAIEDRCLDYPHYLCSGRLTPGDVIELEEYFKSGVIIPPRYEPDWIQNRPALLAFLLYSNFFSIIQLDSIALDSFRVADHS